MAILCCIECDEISELDGAVPSEQICIFCGSIGNFFETEAIPRNISSQFNKFMSTEALKAERKTKFHRIKHGKASYKQLDAVVFKKLYDLMAIQIKREPPNFMASDREFLKGSRKDWMDKTGQTMPRRLSKSEFESRSWGSLWHWLMSAKIRAVADDFIQVNKKVAIYARSDGSLIESGKPDGIFRDLENPNNDYIPIEIKSCSNSAYNLGKIKRSWINQSRRYARIAKYLGWVTKPRVILIIINRESGQWTGGTIDFKDFNPKEILSQSEINTKFDPVLISRFLNGERMPAKIIREYLKQEL
jgi:hypothetical protein